MVYSCVVRTNLNKYLFDVGGVECAGFHEDGVHLLGIFSSSLSADLWEQPGIKVIINIHIRNFKVGASDSIAVYLYSVPVILVQSTHTQVYKVYSVLLWQMA